MTSTIQESNKQCAIRLWEELTGSKIDCPRVTERLNRDFSLFQANRAIAKAREVEGEQALTLVVRNLLTDYAEAVTYRFTLAEIIDGISPKITDIVRRAKALQTFLDQPQIQSTHSDFFQDCIEALAHYRQQSLADITPATHRFIETRSGLIGLDALHDLEKLTRLTMFPGKTDPEAAPKVNQLIFAFDTLEELMEHGAQIPTGFSLCTILSEHISDSYFVLVIRNGERVTIVTDRGNYTHPLQQARMRRRNDRYNLERIENSRFPYNLLNIEWSDNGRRAQPGESGQDLMQSDTGFRVLGSLKDLDDWDLLWLHLFIEQCRQRYFVEQVEEPVLATGSMLTLSHAWGDSRNVPVPTGRRIDFTPLSSSELSTKFLHTIEPQWKHQANPNLWMEDRFAHEVPEDALYVPESALADPEQVPELSVKAGNISLSKATTTGLSILEKERINAVNIQPISAFSLTTREGLIRDAHFVARHNQATVIEKIAQTDYENRRAEMIDWFNRAVIDHLPAFIEELMALNHAYFVVDSKDMSGLIKRFQNPNAIIKSRIISYRRSISVTYEPVAKQRVYTPAHKAINPSVIHALGLADYEQQCHFCYFDRTEPAQVFLRLRIENVADIMKVTGLSLSEIPPELHTRGLSIYTGNGILDRVDPLSQITNPWDKLVLPFCLPVSLKAFKAWRKERGLETPKATELANWSEEQAKATQLDRDRHETDKSEGI